ncbi:DeoR/GlpR family DNA-binding transcription regulator [Oceanibium sediminis]|uniref:DeoR/GlpR family DNA-binding transcription regulator n=1 Tax=Oceanibium sediminis TaxID=2026339 RepID=UPI000DD4978A|nr:DeoR/GlpR family DNA-binding transcription regulator [Oceanibium sediminis]
MNSESLSDRQDMILALLRQQGEVVVDDLASRLQTTPQTIRKDLRALARHGYATRFHGGATLRPGQVYLDYDTRARVAAGAKQMIGVAAARMLPRGATVFLNAGTTTEAVARALTGNHRLSVITDSVHIADILRKLPEVSVIIAGGAVRGADGAVVGAAAVSFLEQFRVDYALIGAAAITADGDLMDYDLDEVMVARTMIRNARDAFLLADGSKFGVNAPVRVAHLSDTTALITDRCESAAIRELCETHGVDLQELSSPSGANPG